MMEEIARTSEKHPLTVIGLITLVTVALLAGIPEIDTRAEMREFLPEDYPSVKTTMEIENEFGLAKYQLILIKSENVTNAEAVKSLLDLEKKLMEEPVLGDYVVSVESYLDFLFSEIVEDDRLLPDNQLEPKIQSLLERPEIRLQTLPYLTLDQKTCLVYVRVNPELERAVAVERTAYFEDFVENHARESGAFEASITGEYSISKDIGDFIQGETRALLAVAILVFVILLLVFRRFSDV
jgi:predicted RND superfamily exporter protein